MSAFVITTSIQGRSRTQVWESSQPLALGHPFQWVLERSDRGVRLRSLAGALNQVQSGTVHEITNDKILKGAEIEIPYFSKKVPTSFKFRIKPVIKSAPAFALAATGEVLRIYQCAGNWVVDSEAMTETYTAKLSGQKVFSLKKSGSHGNTAQYMIQAQSDGLRVSDESSNNRTLKSGESVELSSDVLSKTVLSYVPAGAVTARSWRFGFSSAPQFSDSASTAKISELTREETQAFKKALTYTGVGLAIFAILAVIWPKPKQSEELVPQQFTKIVMATPQKASAAASSESGAPAAKELPKKVQDAAVVQAFRAKALSNAVQGLLKGGMTKLLAQSDFVAGTAKSAEARSILNSKSSALHATSPSAALSNDKNVQVAALGGEAKGEGGKAVGYGKGEHAAVAGQGKGFVPFVSADANGSVVDEGLTKDEVGEVIHKHLSEVRYCYESAMVRQPDIEGKLMAAFTINANGVVKTAEAKSSTLPDPRLDDCIIRRLMTWQFPKPRGGVEVSVSYPFIFKTLGR